MNSESNAYLPPRNRSLIAWIVSRCNSSNQRQDIVTELRRHVPIDIYGECGDRHHTCAVPKGRALSGIDCRLQIHTRYKFYIAFENANCLDYVTEKYFDVLSSTDMVPIVYGGANYKESFPKGSFIDVRDYKGAKELGQYLKVRQIVRDNNGIGFENMYVGLTDFFNSTWETRRKSGWTTLPGEKTTGSKTIGL